ncbi:MULTISPECIES: LETM1 domain-containing protein [Anaeromyxobacter]|uniref:LETM1 domain-containing protein n=1 Tax=Anaeromyxobacter TaxID=161492 RepID=UPI001F5A650F|nr:MULTISPECIES: LETM1 domain-containing protein [unclassified Anaeromyxobacter]
MPRRLTDRRWLGKLLDEELLRHDPDQARARLPAEVRGAGASPLDLAPAANLLVTRSLRRRVAVGRPGASDGSRAPASSAADAFIEEIRAHIGLALDLALLRGDPFVRARRRAEIAAALAAAVGEHAVAIAAEPEQPGGASDRAVDRAARAAAEALHARFYPPGDPAHALPLHAGAVAVLRRRLARVVCGYHRDGRLVAEALARHGAYAVRESALLAEALAGLLGAAGLSGAPVQAVRHRQIARLGLDRAATRETRHAITSPRSPEALAEATPERVRGFLLEQLRLAQLGLKLVHDAPAAWVESFARAARLDAQVIAAAEIEAAAQHADHADWLEALGDGGSSGWHVFTADLDAATDVVVERVSTAVTDNLDALVTEIRETGELGQLLAKAAAGNALTQDEKRKVKAQLVDLAKAVPALAIFAAPGGMLLLPLVAKLLPFSLLPSSWERPGASKRKRAAR